MKAILREWVKLWGNFIGWMIMGMVIVCLLASSVNGAITSVATDGWQATYDGTPGSTILLEPVEVERAGYDQSGAATTHTDTIILTKWIRDPYPDHANLTDTPSLVALSEKLRASSIDVIEGGTVTNNSTAVTPKPICNWVLPDRQVVGNSVTVEIVAFHYDGRNNQQVAFVEARATDGTDEVTQSAFATVVSPRTSDKTAVLVYSITLDITTLDPGPITINAEAYSWIGDSSSINDSADQTDRREFSPRYYLKDVTRFTSPPYAYVNGTSNIAGTFTSGSFADSVTVTQTTSGATAKVVGTQSAGAFLLVSTISGTPNSSDTWVNGGSTFTPSATPTANGNNGTGVWSTTAATAEASPFATVQGAIDAAAAQMPAGDYLAGTGTSRPLDGAIVRISTGTHALGSGSVSSRPQKLAAPIITRDPNVARADAIIAVNRWRARLGVGTLESVTTEGAVIFRDVAIDRTTTLGFEGEAANQLDLIFDDVDFDNNGHSATIFIQSHGRVYGMNLTGAASSFGLAQANYAWRVWRGVYCADFGGFGLEQYLTVGNDINNLGGWSRAPARSASGTIIAFNKFMDRNSINGWTFGSDEDVTGAVFAQNVVEHSGVANGPANKIGGDDFTGNLAHIIHIHNTYIGFDLYGRSNAFYNETTADPRTHTFIRSAANIQVQINTKHDVFHTDGAYTGGWEYLYGVGSFGEFSQFRDAGGGSFVQEYAGALSNIGTSNSVRNDPLFVDYQGTTSGPTAGAGLGDYELTVGSPAAQIVNRGLLSHDIRGRRRPTPVTGNTSTYDAAGAYTFGIPATGASAWWWMQ